MTTATNVGARVDWLTIAFRVRLSKGVLASFVATPDEKPPRDAKFAVRAYLAKKHRVASVKVTMPDARDDDEPAIFRMKMIGEGKTILENGSCRVVLHENAPRSPDDNPNEPGWTVETTFSGTTLIETDYRSAVIQSVHLAAAFGEVLEMRLRRLDLCADMAGFAIPMAEVDGWCTRPQLRSRKMRAVKMCPVPRSERTANAKYARRIIKRYEDGELDRDEMIQHMPDIDDTYYFPEGNCTGWKFGKGLICARVYDKMAEMRMRIQRAGSAAKRKQEGEKKLQEEAWWRRHDWSGKGKITRIEVQVRGEVLHELDARCDSKRSTAYEFADRVGEQLDRVWTYFAGLPDELGRREMPPRDEQGKCSRCHVVHGGPESCKHTLAPKSGWLRQIKLEQGKARSDCTHTEAWEAVQRVVFKDRVMTVPRRTQKRGAVRATQVLGCALALLGFVERLHSPKNPRTGEVIEHQEEDVHAQEIAAPAPIKPTTDPWEKKRREELAESNAKERTIEFLRAELHDVFSQTADEVSDTLAWIHEDKPSDALELVWTRMNAALARWKPLAKAPPRRLREDKTESA